MLACLPFTGVSTLLQKHCDKKQETEECILKLCGYIYHQGTYTPQAGNKKGTGFLPFIGVSCWSNKQNVSHLSNASVMRNLI